MRILPYITTQGTAKQRQFFLNLPFVSFVFIDTDLKIKNRSFGIYFGTHTRGKMFTFWYTFK